MSLKQGIETWVRALAHYDNNEFDEAIKIFNNIADTSKILFNCGVIHATLGEHEKAVECYQRAVLLDNYLAVAYFQEGVSNFLLGDFEEALANFNDTLRNLRGNTSIDYDQLGLKFRLFSCEPTCLPTCLPAIVPTMPPKKSIRLDQDDCICLIYMRKPKINSTQTKGQPPKLSESDINNIIDWISTLKQHHHMPFYKVVKELDLPIGTSALMHALKKQGYICCKALSKPPLSDINKYVYLVCFSILHL